VRGSLLFDRDSDLEGLVSAYTETSEAFAQTSRTCKEIDDTKLQRQIRLLMNSFSMYTCSQAQSQDAHD
jgi:hypothetical protein